MIMFVKHFFLPVYHVLVNGKYSFIVHTCDVKTHIFVSRLFGVSLDSISFRLVGSERFSYKIPYHYFQSNKLYLV